MESTLDRLKALIAAEHHLDVSAATIESSLTDLGLDSLAIAELMFSIEEKFAINLEDVPSDAIPHTVGEVVAVIDSHLAVAEPSKG
jgi:acyl carrier protein